MPFRPDKRGRIHGERKREGEKLIITVSPLTPAQFEMNFHHPHEMCRLYKEWPRNMSVPRIEPKESLMEQCNGNMTLFFSRDV